MSTVKQKNNGGFTLLEVMIASSIFSVIAFVTLTTYTNGVRQHAQALNVNQKQSLGQLRMNQLINELAETKMTSISVDFIANPDIPEDLCYTLTFPTARNADSEFITSSAMPQPEWQGVVIYICDFTRHNLSVEMPDEFFVYRYVKYGTFSYPLRVTGIGETTVTLSNGTTVNKDEFDVFLTDVTRFIVTPGNPSAIDLQLETRGFDDRAVPGYIDFHTEISSRN